MPDQTLPSTRTTFRKPAADFDPNAPRPAALPTVPAKTYPAVLADVRSVPKPQWKLDQDIAAQLAAGKDPSKVKTYQWQWTVLLKSKSAYNHPVRDFTNPTLWMTSTAYKWSTALLGRELEDEEEFDPATLAGTLCMVSVGEYESERTHRKRNTIKELLAAPEEATWDSEIPKGVLDQFLSPTAPPPDAAPAEPEFYHEISKARQLLRAICDAKGLGDEERKSIFREQFGAVKLDDMLPAEQNRVLEYFSSLPDPEPLTEDDF